MSSDSFCRQYSVVLLKLVDDSWKAVLPSSSNTESTHSMGMASLFIEFNEKGL